MPVKIGYDTNVCISKNLSTHLTGDSLDNDWLRIIRTVPRNSAPFIPHRRLIEVGTVQGNVVIWGEKAWVDGESTRS